MPTDLEDLVGRDGETSGFAIFATAMLVLLADRLRMKEVFVFVWHQRHTSHNKGLSQNSASYAGQSNFG